MAHALKRAASMDDAQGEKVPDYHDFLPRGATRFGVMDEANERAFLAQFPKLKGDLDTLKRKVEKFKNGFGELPAAMPFIEAIRWELVVKPLDTPGEDDGPGNMAFQVQLHVEGQKDKLARLMENLYWLRELPKLDEEAIQDERDSAERYRKSVEELLTWTTGLTARDFPDAHITGPKAKTNWPELKWAPQRDAAGNALGKRQFERKINIMKEAFEALRTAQSQQGIIGWTQNRLAQGLLAEWEVDALKRAFRNRPIEPSADRLPLMFIYDPVAQAREDAENAAEETARQRAAEARRALLPPHSGAVEAPRRHTRRYALAVALGATLAAAAVGLLNRADDPDPNNPVAGSADPTPDGGEIVASRENQEIAEIALQALQSGVGDRNAVLEYAEFGNMERLYMAIRAYFDSMMRSVGLSMREVELTFEPIGSGGPPFAYRIKGIASIYAEGETQPKYAIPMSYDLIELEEPLANPDAKMADYLVQRAVRSGYYGIVTGQRMDEVEQTVFRRGFAQLAGQKGVSYRLEELRDIQKTSEDGSRTTYTFTAVVLGPNNEPYETTQTVTLDSDFTPRQDSSFPELGPIPNETIGKTIRALGETELNRGLLKPLEEGRITFPLDPEKHNELYKEIMEDVAYAVNKTLRQYTDTPEGMRVIDHGIGWGSDPQTPLVLELVIKTDQGELYVERVEIPRMLVE